MADNNQEYSPDTNSTDAAMAEGDANAAQAELDRLNNELQAARDQALRAQAELDNFRKRMFREMEQERRFALTPLITDLLPVIDNLDRALQSASAESSSPLLAGVQLVAKELRSLLERRGCKPIEAQGTEFDPNEHQAISRQVTSEHPPGTILHVAQIGWRLHDRVIRPAQVIVAASPDEQ